MRVELEHGQWATFRDDVEEISNRDRKPVQALLLDESLPPTTRRLQAAEVLLKWLIVGWSLTTPDGAPRPLPRDDPGVLDEIRARDADLLIKAASEASDRVWADFKVSPDPNRPGGSSNGSASAPEGTPPSSTPAASPTPTAPTSSAAGSAGL